MKLLIVEDERDVAEVIAFGSRIAWPDCEIVYATDGTEALVKFAAESPDLITLDAMMPPPDGFEVCARIREQSQVPILMLTVRDAVLDKVRALEIGADDYLTKPFDHLELLARLRALVRRSNISPSSSSTTLTVGDLVIDPRTHEVTVGGQPVPLTATEYRLLEALARHAGTVVPHRRLLEWVWGDEYVRDVGYLKVFVRRLRQKLGDDADRPRYIQTHWGVGYRLVPAP